VAEKRSGAFLIGNFGECRLGRALQVSPDQFGGASLSYPGRDNRFAFRFILIGEAIAGLSL
jgi:hypothetical protein